MVDEATPSLVLPASTGAYILTAAMLAAAPT